MVPPFTVGACARICCQFAAAAAAAVPGCGCKRAAAEAPGGAWPPPRRAAQPALLLNPVVADVGVWWVRLGMRAMAG